MEDRLELRVIARMESEFSTKFGVPRQAGLVEGLRSRVVFEPPYRNRDALRGLEDFSHLWLIWGFHMARREDWSPTVRPPRLGGNRRLGVFATRSPFRPNPLALSCVRLEGMEDTPKGPALLVSGADLMNGTPIYDIKPYVPYADCRPEASHGFADPPRPTLRVDFPGELRALLPPDRAQALAETLAWDPRPRYQDDPDRVYGMAFGGWEVKFRVAGERLTVVGLERREEEPLCPIRSAPSGAFSSGAG